MGIVLETYEPDIFDTS